MNDAALLRLRARWNEAMKAMIRDNYAIGNDRIYRRAAVKALNHFFRTLEQEIDITDREFETE